MPRVSTREPGAAHERLAGRLTGGSNAASGYEDTSRCVPAAPRDAPHEALANSLSLDSLAALPSASGACSRGASRSRGDPPLRRGDSLDRSVAHAHQRLARKHADLTWMQGVAPNWPPRSPAGSHGESLLVIIDRSARESGLAGALAGSEPGGPGACRYDSPRRLRYAGRLARPSRQQNGVSVESASIEKADATGL